MVNVDAGVRLLTCEIFSGKTEFPKQLKRASRNIEHGGARGRTSNQYTSARQCAQQDTTSIIDFTCEIFSVTSTRGHGRWVKRIGICPHLYIYIYIERERGVFDRRGAQNHAGVASFVPSTVKILRTIQCFPDDLVWRKYLICLGASGILGCLGNF